MKDRLIWQLFVLLENDFFKGDFFDDVHVLVTNDHVVDDDDVNSYDNDDDNHHHLH